MPSTAQSTRLSAAPEPTANGAKPTFDGWALMLITLLVAASAFQALRLELAGLQVHAVLFPVAAAFPLRALPSIPRVPRDITVAAMVFLAIFSIATIPSEGSLTEILKVSATLVTGLTVATMVRNVSDFRLGAIGYICAITVISMYGMVNAIDETPLQGINPFEEIANKNAFSVYALPAILLAAYVALDSRAAHWQRIVAAACILVMIFAIFSTANRSGWLGVGLIGTMLITRRGRRMRSALLVGALTVTGYLLIAYYGDTPMLEHRVEQTTAGYSSDDLRIELVTASIEIGFDNPLLGVSPQRLPLELARRISSPARVIDPHNLPGFLLGGGRAHV